VSSPAEFVTTEPNKLTTISSSGSGWGCSGLVRLSLTLSVKFCEQIKLERTLFPIQITLKQLIPSIYPFSFTKIFNFSAFQDRSYSVCSLLGFETI
jgi:hypothetical protein